MAPAVDQALISAIKARNLSAVQELLEKGAEVNVVASDGRPPLQWAVLAEHEGIVKLLLEKGAEINVVTSNGVTPLLVAVGDGHEGIVKLLLEKGAEVNVAASDGRPPLLLAASNGHEDIVKLLLAAGANPNIKNRRGQKASDITNNQEIAKLLRSFEVIYFLTTGSIDIENNKFIPKEAKNINEYRDLELPTEQDLAVNLELFKERFFKNIFACHKPEEVMEAVQKLANNLNIINAMDKSTVWSKAIEESIKPFVDKGVMSLSIAAAQAVVHSMKDPTQITEKTLGPLPEGAMDNLQMIRGNIPTRLKREIRIRRN